MSRVPHRNFKSGFSPYFHLVSRETIPHDVVEIWHLNPFNGTGLLTPKDKGADSDKEQGGLGGAERLFFEDSDEEVDESGPSSSKGKGKKRTHRLVESDESNDSDESLPSKSKPITTSRCLLSTHYDVSHASIQFSACRGNTFG